MFKNIDFSGSSSFKTKLSKLIGLLVGQGQIHRGAALGCDPSLLHDNFCFLYFECLANLATVIINVIISL